MNDRLPPHSIEAERGLLGCVLLDGECMGDVVEVTRNNAMLFYDLRHRTIFSAFVEMYTKSQAIDVLTAFEFLRERDQSDLVGGGR